MHRDQQVRGAEHARGASSTFEDRDRLIREEPEVYYITDHYVTYPCVLVRLPKIRRGALRDLLGHAWRYVMERTPKRAPKRGKRAKPTGR